MIYFAAPMLPDLDFASQLALQTGKFLLDKFKLTGTSASLKADHSLVTEADLSADHLIAEAIRANYPEDGLISEELQPVYPENTRCVWVVDPLDGTTNFSLGLPFWGISIAHLSDGLPDLAAVYFPPLGELYTAYKGNGTFLNAQSIHVKPPSKDQTATFFACCSRTHRRYHISVPYKSRILGSATYNFCSLARGIAILVFEAAPKLWDIAAAWLIVTEAGGVIETFDGSTPFTPIPGLDYTSQIFPTLAAATGDLAQKAHSQIVLKNRDR